MYTDLRMATVRNDGMDNTKEMRKKLREGKKKRNHKSVYKAWLFFFFLLAPPTLSQRCPYGIECKSL